MEYTIDKNAHYYLLMRPLEGVILPYGPNRCSREKWVECEVVEDNYKISEGYKVEFSSIEDGYGRESFYLDDFESLQKYGCIVKKTEDMCCAEEEWIEPITNMAYVYHRAYVLRPMKKSTK